MKLLLKNGRVVDPANKLDEVRDVLVDNSKISRISPRINGGADKTIDASGKIVIPGLVDMHVHLREPGREDKETVASGTRAALAGGVTSVLAMPNTSPAIDSAENVSMLREIVRNTAAANVFISGSITAQRKGERLTPLSALKKAGAIAVTDDGSSVDSEELMMHALKTAKAQKMLVICHCEDKRLAAKGVVNLGLTSTRLGLRGISRESEYKRVERDILLADKIKARLHIAHVSTRESVEIISRAKKKGSRVSAETAPHYFALSEEAVWGYNTNMKINPPLRGRNDVEAITQGLRDGTIDAIASDHAPHTKSEKDVEFDYAEFGSIGLETLLAASMTELLREGILDWQDLVRKVSLHPAKILGIDKGTLSVGKDADITIIDPDKEWVFDKEDIVSMSKNSAFLGLKFKGRVDCTILAGKIAFERAAHGA